MSDPRSPATQHHTVLITLVREHGWRRGAEIGVLKAKTLAALLVACPSLHMTGVDQWRHLPPAAAAGHETYQRFDMARCERDARQVEALFPGRCRLLKRDSIEAARSIEDGALDFVFIDAAHTEEATRRNIIAWAPKVRAGGWVLGHDWWWDSVAAALDSTVPGWRGLDQSVWAIPRDEVTAC